MSAKRSACAASLSVSAQYAFCRQNAFQSYSKRPENALPDRGQRERSRRDLPAPLDLVIRHGAITRAPEQARQPALPLPHRRLALRRPPFVREAPRRDRKAVAHIDEARVQRVARDPQIRALRHDRSARLRRQRRPRRRRQIQTLTARRRQTHTARRRRRPQNRFAQSRNLRLAQRSLGRLGER